MVQRKRIIYVRPFKGEIKPNDLQLITDELSTDLKENGKNGLKIIFNHLNLY